MSNEIQSARILRDLLRRRLSGGELAICELVADGHELEHGTEDWATFQRLKTEFAAEIARESDRSPVIEAALAGAATLGPVFLAAIFNLILP